MNQFTPTPSWLYQSGNPIIYFLERFSYKIVEMQRLETSYAFDGSQCGFVNWKRFLKIGREEEDAGEIEEGDRKKEGRKKDASVSSSDNFSKRGKLDLPIENKKDERK